MIEHLVLAVHPLLSFMDAGGLDATDRMGVAAACVYDYSTDRFRLFAPDSLPQLRNWLFKADWITGHCPTRWEYPLLFGSTYDAWRTNPSYRILAGKTNDLCQRLALAVGVNLAATPEFPRNWNLGMLAEGTIGRRRVGDGFQSPYHVRRGEWDALADYLLDDCATVRDIATFAERHGYLVNGRTNLRIALRGTSPRSPLSDRDVLGEYEAQVIKNPGGPLPEFYMPEAIKALHAQAAADLAKLKQQEEQTHVGGPTGSDPGVRQPETGGEDPPDERGGAG